MAHARVLELELESRRLTEELQQVCNKRGLSLFVCLIALHNLLCTLACDDNH